MTATLNPKDIQYETKKKMKENNENKQKVYENMCCVSIFWHLKCCCFWPFNRDKQFLGFTQTLSSTTTIDRSNLSLFPFKNDFFLYILHSHTFVFENIFIFLSLPLSLSPFLSPLYFISMLLGIYFERSIQGKGTAADWGRRRKWIYVHTKICLFCWTKKRSLFYKDNKSNDITRGTLRP